MMQTGNIIERLLELVSLHANGKHTVFAKKAGIPHGTFSAYIKGRMPHAAHLCRIHDTYNVNINWLLTGEGKMLRGDKKGPLYNKVEDEDPEIVELLSRTMEILKSGTDYSASLSANIRSFHHAIKTENRLNGVESRLATLEAERKKSEEIRKEDPTEKKEGFIKRRAM